MPGTTIAPAYTSTVDTFLVGTALGQSGTVTLGGPLDSVTKHAGFALNQPIDLNVLGTLNKSGEILGHASPTPTWQEAHAFLEAILLPHPEWDLEEVDLLSGTHRIRDEGWVPSGGFAFGFRLQRVVGGLKIPLRKTPIVAGYALHVDFLAVLQSQ